MQSVLREAFSQEVGQCTHCHSARYSAYSGQFGNESRGALCRRGLKRECLDAVSSCQKDGVAGSNQKNSMGQHGCACEFNLGVKKSVFRECLRNGESVEGTVLCFAMKNNGGMWIKG